MSNVGNPRGAQFTFANGQRWGWTPGAGTRRAGDAAWIASQLGLDRFGAAYNWAGDATRGVALNGHQGVYGGLDRFLYAMNGINRDARTWTAQQVQQAINLANRRGGGGASGWTLGAVAPPPSASPPSASTPDPTPPAPTPNYLAGYSADALRYFAPILNNRDAQTGIYDEEPQLLWDYGARQEAGGDLTTDYGQWVARDYNAANAEWQRESVRNPHLRAADYFGARLAGARQRYGLQPGAASLWQPAGRGL